MKDRIEEILNEWEQIAGTTNGSEYEWLRDKLTDIKQDCIAVVEGKKPKGISVIVQAGSEFTTPRMYRKLGYERACDDIIKALSE